MKFKEKVRSHTWLAHNVVRLELPKPKDFNYKVGDAIEIKVGEEGPGPFTMTNLHDESHLEFVIRIYPNHNGLTQAISQLKEGDEIEFTEPFKTFVPKGNATFIAGGTGLTPLIAIIRYLHELEKLGDSQLFFSNKTRKDTFLDDELRKMLGGNLQHIITDDSSDPDYYDHIDADYLRDKINDYSKPVYVCGPPKFEEAIIDVLGELDIKKEQIHTSS